MEFSKAYEEQQVRIAMEVFKQICQKIFRAILIIGCVVVFQAIFATSILILYELTRW